MRIRRRICSMTIIGTVGIFLVGCNGTAVRESESIAPSYRNPGIIALVPFFVGRPDTTGQRLARCPRCEGYIVVGEIAPEVPQIVTSLFRRRLILDQYNLVAPEMVADTLPTSRSLEEQPEVLAQRLAPRVKADSVLVGWVFRYRERIGGPWAAQEPASVAFVAILFNAKDGRLLWRGKVDETQEPLSENVLKFSSFVRRGGRWLTAKQLAADGTNRLLMSFPGVPAARK